MNLAELQIFIAQALKSSEFLEIQDVIIYDDEKDKDVKVVLMVLRTGKVFEIKVRTMV